MASGKSSSPCTVTSNVPTSDVPTPSILWSCTFSISIVLDQKVLMSLFSHWCFRQYVLTFMVHPVKVLLNRSLVVCCCCSIKVLCAGFCFAALCLVMPKGVVTSEVTLWFMFLCCEAVWGQPVSEKQGSAAPSVLSRELQSNLKCA